MSIEAQKIENINHLARELYLAGNYEELYTKYDGAREPEVAGYRRLAALELGEPLQHRDAELSNSELKQLIQGMEAFQAQNYRQAAPALAAWLLKNDMISSLILRRFIKSAESSGNHELIVSIGNRFMKRSEYHNLLAEPLLNALYSLNRHQEVVDFFEKYRECFSDLSVLNSVSFSLMQLERFEEAERFLLFLYKKVNGHDYESSYEKVKASYSKTIGEIDRLEQDKANLSSERKMELGMAYLFCSRFTEAISIFMELSRQKTSLA